MFKNCCGCKDSKTNKDDVGEAYGPNMSGGKDTADVKTTKSPASKSDTPLPNVTVTEPGAGALMCSKPETDARNNGKQSSEAKGNDTKDEALEGEHDEAQSEELDETIETETGGRSRLPSEAEVDRATLQALARGMLATPHPAKRNSGGTITLAALPRWVSQEDDDITAEGGGTAEPPATPVGRDELALRRHRFFSDLLQAHQAGAEHRVHFDPLGPVVAGGEYTRPMVLSFGKSD
jgi:hypothetical protein